MMEREIDQTDRANKIEKVPVFVLVPASVALHIASITPVLPERVRDKADKVAGTIFDELHERYTTRMRVKKGSKRGG